jgi:type I site-specific restriction endonuclease
LRTPNGALPADWTDLAAGRARTFWISPTPRDVTRVEPEEWDQMLSSVRGSWQDRFFFRQERRGSDGEVIETGLRPPQIGALHATLAHWTVSDEVATVVMPTGTGKTETMLALLASQRLERLLVVVPQGNRTYPSKTLSR